MNGRCYFDIAQRSDEWFAKRTGSLTGSRAQAMLTQPKKKGGVSKTRQRLIAEMAEERISGVGEKSTILTPDMQHGIDQEANAISCYEATTLQRVTPIGYIEHQTLAWVGCSPDGLVGPCGMIEVKCMAPHNHLEVLRTREAPRAVMAQLRHNLFTSEREWIDYVAFRPSLPENAQIFIQRFTADELKLDEYQLEVVSFLDAVSEAVDEIQQWRPDGEKRSE